MLLVTPQCGFQGSLTAHFHISWVWSNFLRTAKVVQFAEVQRDVRVPKAPCWPNPSYRYLLTLDTATCDPQKGGLWQLWRVGEMWQ